MGARWTWKDVDGSGWALVGVCGRWTGVGKFGRGLVDVDGRGWARVSIGGRAERRWALVVVGRC